MKDVKESVTQKFTKTYGISLDPFRYNSLLKNLIYCNCDILQQREKNKSEKEKNLE